MNGGMVVVGRVTGTHMIEDLHVVVPYMVPVALTPEQVVRSRDLNRALQQQKIFKLDVTPFKPESPSREDWRAELEQENQSLKARLLVSETQRKGLEASLEGLQQQLNTVVGILERIEKAGAVVIRGGEAIPATEAVGGDVPAYIPDKIHPETVETSITAEEDTTEGSSVADAASRLRELRRKAVEDRLEEDEDLDFG